MIYKKKDSITYDVKAKVISGKYIFISDMISDYNEAIKLAEDTFKKNKEEVGSIEIWETKNKLTTNFKLRIP